jgi:hypothetical protein
VLDTTCPNTDYTNTTVLDTTGQTTDYTNSTVLDTTGYTTTCFDTTVQSTGYDPYVLVCVGAPSEPVFMNDSNNAKERNGNGSIDPYQMIGFTIEFKGPQVGDYSFTDFLIEIWSSCTTVGDPTILAAVQLVGFSSSLEVTFSPPASTESWNDARDNRDLTILVELKNGKISQAFAQWHSGVGIANFGSGPVPADISGCTCDIGALNPEGWSFGVMLLSEAIEYQQSLLE